MDMDMDMEIGDRYGDRYGDGYGDGYGIDIIWISLVFTYKYQWKYIYSL